MKTPTTNANWRIKYYRNQVVYLGKGNGPFVQVRIEYVTADRGGVNYGVREIETGIGYPADQRSLKSIPSVR